MQLFQVTVPSTHYTGSIFTLKSEAMDIAQSISKTIKTKVRLVCYKASGDESPINGCIRLEMFNYFDFKDGKML